MIKLSIDDTFKLYKLASIGKLVGGLIHNLNGPMQNLGLDIEMARFSLKDEAKWDQDTANDIILRLKRMEEEHDKMNSLIRAISERVEDNYKPENIPLSNIHEFIKQEFAYLQANLYFKHNVQKEIVNPDYQTNASTLPKDYFMALGWFLQCLVEELEAQKIGGLTVKIISDNSKLKIVFSTDRGRLSEEFIGQLKSTISSEDTLKSDSANMGIFLALLIFKSNGIFFEFNSGSSASDLILNFP